ncbi:hypothetical protein VitviT2T_013226 [Vitis vinifera]|uniref:Uncharacterized protein n=1 Tax=Vitis vinifera TaxID=29760 RepID=A0ABY9CJG0_VITVI|nr:hypothetical protein VitviT2T_013226 [Vitis vinifera]
MLRVVLLASAHLHNVALLQPEGGSDDEEMNYFFRLKCEQCGWISENELKCEQCGWISENEECVNMAVQERAPGSSRRNSRVNLSRKCEGCERQGTITLVPGHGRPLRVDDCTNVPLMVFDCNGTFPVYYSFNGGWRFRWFRLFLFLLLCFSFCLLPISAPFVIPSASSISKFGLGVVEAQDSNARELQWTLKCEQCGWISENEECVNMAVQERAPGSSRRNSRVNLSLKCEGCERQGTITLVPGHTRPLRVDDCTNVPLMVFYCNGTFPVHYSSNGGWSAVTEFGESINLNPVERKYNVVVDGEYIEIKELKTKFEPYNGRHYAWFFVMRFRWSS